MLGKEEPSERHVGGQRDGGGGFGGAGAGFGLAVECVEGEHQKHTRCPPPRNRKKKRKYISIVCTKAKYALKGVFNKPTFKQGADTHKFKPL
jgi:hypothetical protein